MTASFDHLRQRAGEEWRALSGLRPLIRVGTATCGRSVGAMEVLETFRREARDRGLDCSIVEVGCTGSCYAEPMVCITKPSRPAICYGNVTPGRAVELVERYLIHDDPLADGALGTIGDGDIEGIPPLSHAPVFGHQVRWVLRNCGLIDPANIDHYLANNGYSGLRKALETAPEQIVEEMRRSGLRGRGGAGFPTWRKWQFSLDAQADEKYVICNGSEGDPGAFSNKLLLESDPHSVLEGLLIAAYTIDATEGYVYCPAGHPLVSERLRIALRQMEDYGLLGDNILGSSFSFRIKIKEGAGMYVCGEETALIEYIEGKRGVPRSRPPYPTVSGLWNRPTIVNNVETLACVTLVLQNGAQWFAELGTKESKGTKTFCLSGDVKHSGVVEVPLGTTLRELIYGIGGGTLDGKGIKAVQTGGAGGGCLPSSLLDTPVDHDSLLKFGSAMGSGGVVVMGAETCVVDMARHFIDFAQRESCGKCVPCRLGTKQMLDILEDVTLGRGRLEDIDLLLEIGEAMEAGSLCGLGQTAPNPVLATIRYFMDEYKAHIVEKRCPARVCRTLSGQSTDGGAH